MTHDKVPTGRNFWLAHTGADPGFIEDGCKVWIRTPPPNNTKKTKKTDTKRYVDKQHGSRGT